MNPIFFDHIPKAGGMSLVRVFQNILGKSAVLHVNGQRLSTSCNHWIDMPVVSGHFHFAPRESLPVDRFCLTMLREPLDRVLSSYYFARHNNSVALSTNAAAAQSISLEDYVEREDLDIRRDISNAQTNHFYPLVWTGSNVPDDEQKLSAAKLALEQFHLVGVLEHYEDFVDLLCYEQSWPPVREIPRENITTWRQEVLKLPSHVLARLRVLNNLDTELYEHARKLFHSHRRRIIIACIGQRCDVANGLAVPPVTTPQREFLPRVQSARLSSEGPDFGDRGAEIVSISVCGDLMATAQVLSGELFVCRVIFRANEDISNLTVGMHIFDEHGSLAFGTNSRLLGTRLSVTKGAEYFVEFAARCDLGVGNYKIGAALHLAVDHLQRCFHWRQADEKFEVIGHLGYHAEGFVKLHPVIHCGALDSTKGLMIQDAVNLENAGLRVLGRYVPPLSEFSAVIRSLNSKPIKVSTRQIFEIEVEVSNTGQCLWPAVGTRPVYISYHWLDSNGNTLIEDGKRTPLPCDMPPATTFRMWASILAPAQIGHARLQLTLVQEQVAWFNEKGSSPAEIEVMVGSTYTDLRDSPQEGSLGFHA